MSLEVVAGNIFTSPHQTIVNTVNCVGVMGAGLALECRLRYPKMFEEYRAICMKGRLRPGMLWLYRGGYPSDMDTRWILNFPTKDHWKFQSKLEYVESGLAKFLLSYKDKGISSVAFPVLGGSNGGLDPDMVIDLMVTRLSKCDIPITVYKHSTRAEDDLYQRFSEFVEHGGVELVGVKLNVNRDVAGRICAAVKTRQLCQINQFARMPGIGMRALESIFKFMSELGKHQNLAQEVFEL